jgi:hypothetical protein
MYGVAELAGVSGAAGAGRWLATGQRRWLALSAGAGLVAAFDHATGIIVLAGLLVVPGWRRRRAGATEWRITVALAIAVYALAWGTTAFAQRGASLYAPTTADSAAVTLNEMIAPVPANRVVALAVLVLGIVAVVARRDTLARVVVAVYLVPLAAALALGIVSGAFIPKTLVVLEWGVAVALAGFVVTAARWKPAAGAAAVIVVAALVVPAVPPSLDPAGAETIVARLREVVHDGDIVANHPEDNVLRWYVFRDPDRHLRPAPGLDWPDTVAAKVGDAPFSGRVWLVDSTFLAPPSSPPGRPCADPVELPEGRTLRCVQMPGDLLRRR